MELADTPGQRMQSWKRRRRHIEREDEVGLTPGRATLLVHFDCPESDDDFWIGKCLSAQPMKNRPSVATPFDFPTLHSEFCTVNQSCITLTRTIRAPHSVLFNHPPL